MICWEYPNDRLKKAKKKYTAAQIIDIEMVYNDKKALIKDWQSILENLPKHQNGIDFSPLDTDFKLSEGTLGTHKAVLSVNTEYGIYQILDAPAIESIQQNIIAD